MVNNNTGCCCNVPILKNDGVKVNGKDDIPYMKWNNNPFMFETAVTSDFIDPVNIYTYIYI